MKTPEFELTEEEKSRYEDLYLTNQKMLAGFVTNFENIDADKLTREVTYNQIMKARQKMVDEVMEEPPVGLELPEDRRFIEASWVTKNRSNFLSSPTLTDALRIKHDK